MNILKLATWGDACQTASAAHENVCKNLHLQENSYAFKGGVTIHNNVCLFYQQNWTSNLVNNVKYFTRTYVLINLTMYSI